MESNQNTRRNDNKQLSSQIRIQITKVTEVSKCPVFSRSHVLIVFKNTYPCIEPVHLHCNLSGPTSRTWHQTATSLLDPFVPLVQKVLQYLLLHLDQCLLKKFHFKFFFSYSPPSMSKRSEVVPSRSLGDNPVLWSTFLNIFSVWFNIFSFAFSVLNQDSCEKNYPSIFAFTVLDWK